MRKNILIVGLVLLIIGIILVAASGLNLTHSTGALTITSGNMYQGPNGIYHSQQINITSGQILTITTTSTAYVIPSNDLTVVNQTNVHAYSITPLTSSSNAYTYDKLAGTYYIVVFSSTPPTVTYAVGNLNSLLGAGIMIIIGGLLFIIGLIITIIGAVLRKKVQPGQIQ